MTVRELADSGLFEVVNLGDQPDREITKVFCCDLLSIAMGRAPEGGAWVTVMANMNTLAVASLTDTACVMRTEQPVFEAALQIENRLRGYASQL